MLAAIFVAICGTVSPRAAITFPLQAVWTATLPAPPAFSPAFDDDYAYVALRNNQLLAVLLKDGKTAWSVECPTTAAPAAGGTLVFAGREKLIEARSSTDGSLSWTLSTEGRVVSLSWVSGWLLASTDPGPLLAIRATDGEIIWRRDLGSPLKAPPAPDGERLYLGLTDGRILAMSLKTGDDIWTHTLTEPAVGIMPVGDRVFAASLDNHLHSLDAEDGDPQWKWRTGADLVGLPVLDEKRVYFLALDHVLRGHNRNGGSMLWKRVLPMRPFTGPILSGQTLIVAGISSELRAYNAFDGKPSPAGEFNVKGTENEEMLLAAAPHLTSQDLLILITKGGHVRALGSQTPPPAAP